MQVGFKIQWLSTHQEIQETAEESKQIFNSRNKNLKFTLSSGSCQNSILTFNMNNPTLSVIMIVKNEEKHLPICLDSIRGLADEIIVVDTGSTDGTIKIAEKYNANVCNQKWNGNFAFARNKSISEAKGKWLLWLDADDIIPATEHDKIREIILTNESAAYSCVIENQYEGRPGQAFRQIRIFPSGRNILFEGKVHESLSTSIQNAGLKVVQTNIRIVHTGYNLASDREKKMKRNHELLLAEYSQSPDDLAVIMELGNSFFQLRDYKKAVELYLLIETIPDAKQKQHDIFNAVPVLLGTAYLEMGQKEDAKKQFQSAINRSSDNMTAYYYLGRIALLENNPDMMLSMFEKVAYLKPSVSTVASDITGMRANAFAFAGNLHFVRGNFERALNLFLESDKSNLPAAFQYETAVEAAVKSGKQELAVYFKNKASSTQNKEARNG